MVRSARSRVLLGSLAVAALLLAARRAAADTKVEQRQMTPAEIEAWLDSQGIAGSGDIGSTTETGPPPPPPRHHGLVLETALGALDQLGPLKNVSPISPWFHVQLGYEPFKWLMVFGESDITFADTSYAAPPPPSRTYVLFGFGGGGRITIKPTDAFGIYVEGSAGIAKVSNDALYTYGYLDANALHPYFGGALGLEWYQVNPHCALALSGGVRDYNALLDRTLGGTPALALIVNAALRYTF
jgi:hypothetical protein